MDRKFRFHLDVIRYVNHLVYNPKLMSNKILDKCLLQHEVTIVYVPNSISINNRCHGRLLFP